jgi:RNA polymerase sigma-70 factor (ECF subfamily)
LDDSLVANLRARRADALGDLLRLHGAEIHAVAYMILRDGSYAEEVTADTLLVAWDKIDRLRDPHRLRPWLLRIATRLALRRRFVRGRTQVVSLDRQPEPLQPGISMVDRLALAEALDRLPRAMRAVVALHHVAGLSVPETAEAVGRSPNTVKSQLREALLRLRRELSEDGANLLAARPTQEKSS